MHIYNNAFCSIFHFICLAYSTLIQMDLEIIILILNNLIDQHNDFKNPVYKLGSN